MKREVWYIIAGITGVAASAGISFATGNIWAGFITALIFGILYLIILDRTLIQSLEKPGHKITLRILITALILAQSFAAYIIYDRSQLTENNLAEIRSSIDEGISICYTQQSLLDTFIHYYGQEAQADAIIASSFREVMGERLNADGTIDFYPQLNEDFVFTYEIISPDNVMITASAIIGKGENPEFINVSSKTGKYQAVATLTPNGIGYERQN